MKRDPAMKLPSTPKQRPTARMAFTLVELLVVIAIIIVLASLLLAAVFKALDLANEAATRTDVTQLSAAVQSFQTKYQVNYIPSRIILCKSLANYYVAGSSPPQIKSALHQDSLDYLGRVWPRLNWGTVHPPVPPASVAWAGIDWAGDGQPPPAQTSSLDPILEGEQCLVFFLGGIPSFSTGTVSGFSTNASDPSYHTYAVPPGDIIPPFFEFKSNRLVRFSQLVPSAAGIDDFYVYKDGYGKTPYAYFSSYKTSNGYNRYFLTFGNSDCQTLGVWPYASSLGSSPVYYNAQSFQLISAGKDLTFGPGSNPALPAYGTASTGPYSTWAPSYAAQAYVQGVPGGYDDIANFYDRLLGVPTQ